MRKDGNKLVVQEEDINMVLAFAIRDYQFKNHNELPEVAVIQCGANVKGKDRNGKEYAIPVEVEKFMTHLRTEGISIFPAATVDYFCPECKRTHRVGSKIHKRHLKYLK